MCDASDKQSKQQARDALLIRRISLDVLPIDEGFHTFLHLFHTSILSETSVEYGCGRLGGVLVCSQL